MSKRSEPPILVWALGAIIALLLVLAALLLVPNQSENTETTHSASIPLGNGNFNKPGDVQGNSSYSPQRASTINQAQRDALNL